MPIAYPTHWSILLDIWKYVLAWIIEDLQVYKWVDEKQNWDKNFKLI